MKKNILLTVILVIAFPMFLGEIFMVSPGLSSMILHSKVISGAIAPFSNLQEMCANYNSLWFTTTPPQCISNKGHYFFYGEQNKPVVIPNSTPKPPKLP